MVAESPKGKGARTDACGGLRPGRARRDDAGVRRVAEVKNLAPTDYALMVFVFGLIALMDWRL